MSLGDGFIPGPMAYGLISSFLGSCCDTGLGMEWSRPWGQTISRALPVFTVHPEEEAGTAGFVLQMGRARRREAESISVTLGQKRVPSAGPCLWWHLRTVAIHLAWDLEA